MRVALRVPAPPPRPAHQLGVDVLGLRRQFFGAALAPLLAGARRVVLPRPGEEIRVWGSGFGDWGVGLRVGVQGEGFGVWRAGLRFRVLE